MAKKKRKSDGLEKRLVAEIAVLTRRSSVSLSDKEMDEVCEALLSSSAHLVNAPACDAFEIDLKLAMLCRRLRDQLDPEDRAAVINALLAESIRDDLLLVGAMET
jgi:hypothetical protein